jgi:hypothetical protein
LAFDVWGFFQAGVQGQTLLMVLCVFAGILAVWQLYRHEAELAAEANQKAPDGLEPRWRAFRQRGYPSAQKPQA